MINFLPSKKKMQTPAVENQKSMEDEAIVGVKVEVNVQNNEDEVKKYQTLKNKMDGHKVL